MDSDPAQGRLGAAEPRAGMLRQPSCLCRTGAERLRREAGCRYDGSYSIGRIPGLQPNNLGQPREARRRRQTDTARFPRPSRAAHDPSLDARVWGLSDARVQAAITACDDSAGPAGTRGLTPIPDLDEARNRAPDPV